MVLSRALAICADSSRSMSCAAVSDANCCVIKACSASREATRLGLLSKRGSRASSGCSSTRSQNSTHSRSFCRPSITVRPSPAVKGP